MKENTVTVFIFSSWIGVFILVWMIDLSLGENVKDFLVHLSRIYFFAIPIGMITFVEKSNVMARLGLNSLRFLGLISLSLVSLVSVYFLFGPSLAESSAINVILLAPFLEEVFFRGYLLGRLKNERTLRSSLLFVSAISLTSTLFTLSHVFKINDPKGMILVFSLGFLMGILYMLTGSILPSVTFHVIYNSSITISSAFLFSEKSLLVILLMAVPTVAIEAYEMFKGKKTLTHEATVNVIP